MDIIEREDRYTSGVYPKRGAAIVRGEGARVWDSEGREYIDCVAGHGVVLVGHCNSAVAQALEEQSKKLITCPEIFYNDVRSELLERLVSVTPASLTRAYLCNSGAEAVEASLKFARLSTERTGIVAAMRSFHGRTMGALSATWKRSYREPFEPLVPDFDHVPYNDIEALEEAVDEGTAAVLLEVVQGEGGVNPAEPEYIQSVRELCDAEGTLLIIDEVQTGFGRTGRFFACEHYDLQPDMMCVAKGIAGGVPMGAVLLSDKVENLSSGVHGSTFGGNPLACAVSLAAIGYIQENDLVAGARRKGEWAFERLSSIDLRLIREVRGLGLMIGIQIRRRVTPYLKALMDKGILALPAGSTVLRLLPPLIITDEDLAAVCDAVEEVLKA